MAAPAMKKPEFFLSVCGAGKRQGQSTRCHQASRWNLDPKSIFDFKPPIIDLFKCHYRSDSACMIAG